jgi:hypothetical protein
MIMPRVHFLALAMFSYVRKKKNSMKKKSTLSRSGSDDEYLRDEVKMLLMVKANSYLIRWIC